MEATPCNSIPPRVHERMHSAPAPAARGLTTPELAQAIGIRPDSLRVHLCRRGSYYGLRPTRLPNGRLLWPADSVERLLGHTAEVA